MSTAAAETTDQVDQDILPEIATISSSDNDNDNNEGLGNDISGQVNVEPAHSEGRIEEALGKSSNIPDDKSSESDSEIRSYSRYKPSARAVRFNGVLPLRARLAGTSASSGIESVHREKVRVRPSWRKRTERRPVKISPPNVIAKIEGMGWVDFADSIRRFDPPASLPFGLSDKHYPSSDENAPPQDVAAIEVLVGEPCVTVGIKADNTTENRTSTQPLLFEMSGTKDENTTTSEDLQLRMRSPARIRFNSQFLIHTLFKYKSQNFVVLVRPFRFLLTNEERIRSIYQQLELEAGMPHADRSTTNARRSQPPDLSSRAVISSKATKLEAMKCLVQLIDEYILPRVSFVRGFDCTRIYFDDLWHLFRPGDRVFHLVNANAAVDIEVLRVICVQGVEHRVRRHRNGPSNRAYGSPFMIYCVAIDFDGKQLGPRKKQYAVDYFEGDKGVRSLPIMPINRLKDDEIQRQLVHNGINFPECQDEHEILQSIVARGKAFLGMTETKHMHFSGTTSFGEELDCPVMIDFDQAFASPEAQGGRTEAKRYPGWKPDLESLVEWTPPENEDSVECLSDCCKHHNVYLDRYMDKENSAAYLDSLTRRDNSKMHSLAIHPRYRHDANTEENPIEDDEFLIMPWKVYGFVFQIRKFRPLSVSQVTPMRESSSDSFDGNGQRCDREEVFDQLVLPLGHKDMIKSLIAQHFRDKQAPSSKRDLWDLVRGKGKGLVILLHGAPGVGKTTTAECVADYFRRPLFQLSCGDLGMWAEQVESALRETFALAGRWGCILLLDEADVFLSARTPTDLLRNSIVSVFLRVIEYYSGILFLTTNRVGDFDEAFASRIHMSLYYPPLDLDATISVFDLNMNRLQRRFERKGIQLLIKKSNIIAYATLHWNTYPGARWNGRQIRNACQTALALAEFEAQGGNHEAIIDPNAVVSLEVKHFDTVANTYLGFMNYLKDIYGVNLDERAKENFVRAGVRNSQVTSPPNPLSPRRHDPEPSFRQTFDRRPRVWNPLNSSAQGSGLSRPFQPSYSQLGETPFPTNIVRPTMHTQYPQNQAYMQQTPASEFNQSSFAADILQNASYLNSLPGGFTQTAGQAQQTLQRPQVQQVQQSQHQPMASQQAAGPGVQPNPFAAARPNDQYPNYPTASNVWTQNSGLMSTDSTEPGSSQSTNINTTQRRP